VKAAFALLFFEEVGERIDDCETFGGITVFFFFDEFFLLGLWTSFGLRFGEHFFLITLWVSIVVPNIVDLLF
jgi:hypothetical protein